MPTIDHTYDYNPKAETADAYNARIAAYNASKNPAPEQPTLSQLYGSVSSIEQGVDNSLALYKAAADTSIDEQGIRDATMKRLQAEIDATNQVYAEKLRQAHIAGENNLGTTSAINARRGLLGSDFGNASDQNVRTENEKVYSGIGDERARAIADIVNTGTQLANQEIANKQTAKQQGAQNYIAFLSESEKRRDARTQDAAKRAIAAGIDLTGLSKSDIQAIANSFQISPDALVSTYTDAVRALAAQQADIAAKQAAAKKDSLISIPYGGSLYNSGTNEIIGGIDNGAKDLVSQAIQDGRLDASQITRYGMPFIISTLQDNPNYDFAAAHTDYQRAIADSTAVTTDAFGNKITYQTKGDNPPVITAPTGPDNTVPTPKADAASLTKQQEYADSTQRAFNTANQNLTALVSYMKSAGVNNGSTVPLINTLTNKAKAGALDPGTVQAYQAALAGLRAEYAQVLSRGGEVTDSQRHQAAELIPDNLTPAQLQQVAERLNIEGTNAVKEAQAQVAAIKSRASGQPQAETQVYQGHTYVRVNGGWQLQK